MNELKKCPFCGGEARWWDTEDEKYPYQIYCTHCYCGTDKMAHEEYAIERWNTRKPSEEVVARLEELRMRAVENDCSIAEAWECYSYYCETCYMDKAIEIVKERMG